MNICASNIFPPICVVNTYNFYFWQISQVCNCVLILCDQQRHPPNQVNGLPAHWKQLKVHKSPRTLKRNQKKFGRTVTMSLVTYTTRKPGQRKTCLGMIPALCYANASYNCVMWVAGCTHTLQMKERNYTVNVTWFCFVFQTAVTIKTYDNDADFKECLYLGKSIL